MDTGATRTVEALPSAEQLAEWQEALWSSEAGKTVRAYLEKHGVPLDIAKQARLGMGNDRLTIPIFDAAGSLLQVKYHATFREMCPKVFTVAGRGVHAYPLDWHDQTSPESVIAEGEVDALCLFGVATICEDRRAFSPHDRDTGGSTETGQPLEPITRRMHVLALELIRLGNDEGSQAQVVELSPEIFDLLLSVLRLAISCLAVSCLVVLAIHDNQRLPIPLSLPDSDLRPGRRRESTR